MGRAVTCGFEAQSFVAEGELLTVGGGAPAIELVTVRGGLASMKCTTLNDFVSWGITFALGSTFFIRFYFRYTAPQTTIMGLLNIPGTSGMSIQLDASNRLTLSDGAGAVQIGPTAPLNQNQWYRVEAKFQPVSAGTNSAELMLDGVLQGTSATLSTAHGSPTGLQLGLPTGTTAAGSYFFDDVAVNNATGANQNSYPGVGRIVLLKPVSDASRAGFTGGAGGTVNLFDALNNTPPTGTTDPGTDASQIRSANANATDFMQVNLAAYSASLASGGGAMVTGEKVAFAQGLARGGYSTITSETLAFTMVSNPNITEQTTASGTTAVAAEPTGWTSFRNAAVQYFPIVAPNTGPVMKVRRATTTNVCMYDLIGLVVEIVPAQSLLFNPQTTRRTLLRM